MHGAVLHQPAAPEVAAAHESDADAGGSGRDASGSWIGAVASNPSAGASGASPRRSAPRDSRNDAISRASAAGRRTSCLCGRPI